MAKVVLKTVKRKTTVSREAVREAVAIVFTEKKNPKTAKRKVLKKSSST